MSNDFFNHSANRVPTGVRAVAAFDNNIADEIAAGFDKLPTESQLKRGLINLGTDTGAANAYVVALPHAPTAYTDAMEVMFYPTNSNTGAATVNIDGLGAKSIKRVDGSDSVANDMLANKLVGLRYNATDNVFYFYGVHPLQLSAGPKGEFAGVALGYVWSTDTAASDPGASKLKASNTDLSLATTLRFDDLDSTANDAQAFIRTFDDSTNPTVKGILKLSEELDATRYVIYEVTAVTEQAGYFDVAVTHVVGSVTSFATGKSILASYSRSGDKGLGETGFLNASMALNQESSITLTQSLDAIGKFTAMVTKEVAQLGITNNYWGINTDDTLFDLQDSAYTVTLTPSNTTGVVTLTKSSGTWAASDVGKRVVGNSGEAIIFGTSGSASIKAVVITDFADTSGIVSGSWYLYAGWFEGGSFQPSNSINESSPWDIENLAYSKLKDISAQTISPTGVEFGDSDSKMYVGDSTAIYQYSVTGGEVDTASFVTSKTGLGFGAFTLSNNGTKLYLVSVTDVKQYTLSTPWDISTATYDTVLFDASGQDTVFRGIKFNTSGTKMYLLGDGASTAHVYQYTLSTAWVVSSASYDTVSLDLTGQSAQPFGLAFSGDGVKLLILNYQTDTILQYVLTTGWDLSTGAYDNISKSISAQDTVPYGIDISEDGLKVYTVGQTNDNVYQYNCNAVKKAAKDQYIAAITNATGQIDTNLWTDFNSMTATDTLAGHLAYYAWSTDGRTTFNIVGSAETAERSIVRNNAGTWEYNSNVTYGSTTWASAAVNNIYEAFSDAMGVAQNRMDSTALNAVADAYFPAITTTFDFALVVRTSSDVAVPTIDSVAIDYDGNTLTQQAVNGTDYRLDNPSVSEVRLKALTAGNYRVQVHR